MHDREPDGFVDELLEATLARYAHAEPRPGLEERLLADLRATPRPVPWVGWVWVPAGAAVMVVVAALAWQLARQSPPAPAGPPAITEQAAVSPPAAGAVRAEPTLRPRRFVLPALQAAAYPRRDLFPSPAPLSEQERLLLRYVQETPLEQLVAMGFGQGPLEELRIQPLHIPPLSFEPN